ncbi:hypothetical protein C1646_717956 [Rhizophagus diaphanus]|nr:hypothetical protein C1646_717956 [Rhizophagus diaphanus] [Rhizophagus sp. MUCL 43196]
MEDCRNLQITEHKIPCNFSDNDISVFIYKTFTNYIELSEGLFSSFFTGDIEVQRNIIHANK